MSINRHDGSSGLWSGGSCSKGQWRWAASLCTARLRDSAGTRTRGGALVDGGRARGVALHGPAGRGRQCPPAHPCKGRAANTFVHNRNLTSVLTQRVTSPNNDTLYSHGVLDLRTGPVALGLPPTGDRYLSVQLTRRYVYQHHRRAWHAYDRTEGGCFIVAGPTGAAPAGAIRAPSDWVFVLARTLVDEADLPARAVQDGLVIEGANGPALTVPVPARCAVRRLFQAGGGAACRIAAACDR